MTNQKFSMILTTIRGPKELEPLFTVTDKDTELIITDSNYNEETKKWLQDKTGYEQIVYAPVKQQSIHYVKDNVLGYNIAFMFAENDWIVRADDNLELKDDFFEKARDNINYFRESLGHEKFAVIGQKLWGSQGHQRWENHGGMHGGRYHKIQDSTFTFSFGLMPIEMVYDLNGYQEIYDLGYAWDDVDVMDRGFVAGYEFWYDKELMGYSFPHQPANPTLSVNKFLYDLQLLEIRSGKSYAYNSYNIRKSQSVVLAAKNDFIVR